MKTTDPYDILGASPIDSPETIKARYRQCVLKYHPDKPSGNEEMYKMVVWAYNSITDPENAGPSPEHISNRNTRRSGSSKRQSARRTRRNPGRKGRAARRAARQASRHRRTGTGRQKTCNRCMGMGYVEHTTGRIFRKTQRTTCTICDGKGTIGTT